MKVVLFCGGQGVRLREFGEGIPKPMVPLGSRPVLWHVMRYYAHFGHTEFILCLGYRAEAIKDYFLHYNEALSNDFVMAQGGREIELLGSDISDWRISFVDTGVNTSIGQRLRAVRRFVGTDEVFLANYADVLTDAPLNTFVDRFVASDAVASCIAIHPTMYTFHLLGVGDDGRVTSLDSVESSDIRINGGYFVLRRSIFEWLGDDDDLVPDVFPRLATAGKLIAHPYQGFWAPMDTLKDRVSLEAQLEAGQPKWAVWMSREPDAVS